MLNNTDSQTGEDSRLHLTPLIARLPFAADVELLYEASRHEPDCVLLDSGRARPHAEGKSQAATSRYTIIALDPFCKLYSEGEKLIVAKRHSPRNGWHTVVHPHASISAALDTLDQTIRQYPLTLGGSSGDRGVDSPGEHIPFWGGAIGWLSYDSALSWYGLSPSSYVSDRSIPLPDIHFALYHKVIVIDLQEQVTWVAVSDPWAERTTGSTSGTFSSQTALEELVERVRSCRWHSVSPSRATEPTVQDAQHSNVTRRAVSHTGQHLPSYLKPDLDRNEYLQRVQQVLRYIAAGDIYQVNFTHRFRRSFHGDPWPLYKRLRAVSPCPFGAYIPTPSGAVLCNSPERFLQWQDGSIEAHPIKGTRRRGATPTEDQALRRELLQSEKDRAELIMITDLLRGDLGRICRYGSVHVPALCAVEAFPTIWHQYSIVRGQLRPHVGLANIFQALFPGGSIVGAPKQRAMEIIHELEPVPRGLYTGAIGYISFHGTADFNVPIRTMIVSDNELSFHVGGGIVADSRPEDEYEETLVKARALILSMETDFMEGDGTWTSG